MSTVTVTSATNAGAITDADTPAAATPPIPPIRSEKLSTYKIFVKNVAGGTSNEELKALFEGFGRVVECQVLKDTFAFVHMEDEACGRNAILMLNAKMVNGRCIGVEESWQKEGPSVPSTRLRVRNVSPSLSALSLRQLFAQYGAILSLEIIGEEAIVTIDALSDVRSCIDSLNGYEAGGSILCVESLVNTAISYNPTRKMREPQPRNQYPPPHRQFQYNGPPRRPMFGRGPGPMAPRFRPPRPPAPQEWGYVPNPYYNPEGRVLRDPVTAGNSNWGPPPVFRSRPPMRHRPPHIRPQIDASIEPLFFKRRQYIPNGPNQEVFSEDDSFNNFDQPSLGTGPSFQQNSFSGSRNGHPHSPPKKPRPLLPIRPEVPLPEEGQPFQPPEMIDPTSFVPPRKYFANRPKQKRKKKSKSERPQLPLPPEPPQKPVPDFSSYYTIPDNSALKPYPAPLNPDGDGDDDFSQDFIFGNLE